MLLLVDIGNTSIALRIADGENLTYLAHYHSDKRTSDEFAAMLLMTFRLNGIEPSCIEAIVLSSVVPELTISFGNAAKRICNKDPMIVGEKHYGSMQCDILPLKYIGADLICGCVGAIENYPLPAIVVDMGTATKLLVIDKSKRFVGCIIAPGLKTALNALTNNASLLPDVGLGVPKKLIGTDTVECIQSGSIFGNAAMIDGLIERICVEQNIKEPSLIATGGYMKHILPACQSNLIYDDDLLFKGMLEIYNNEI